MITPPSYRVAFWRLIDSDLKNRLEHEERISKQVRILRKRHTIKRILREAKA